MAGGGDCDGDTVSVFVLFLEFMIHFNQPSVQYNAFEQLARHAEISTGRV